LLFSSIEFPVFLAIVLTGYYCLGLRAQNAWLLIASYVFYGFWDWRFLILIWVSTAVDYFVGLALAEAAAPRRRKQLVTISLVTNLGILGAFKYFNFFADSMAVLLSQLGFTAHMPTLNIVLPVGISFYTFQTLSYTLDIYRGRLAPTRNPLAFALFVAYFPQLVAGPIERARHLLPALEAPRHVDWRLVATGVELILIGYFKKVGIADTLAPWIDSRYGDPAAYSGADLLLATYLFGFQIYCDFSGYSDIARGTSKLFGVNLMRNFEQPYLASSITEFWHRWHISLSTWLRDYLYISLGGNRQGTARTYRNLMLTMLLGGLWHGANWTFVIWGGLHGVYLVAHKLMLAARGNRQAERPGNLLVRVASALVVFNLVSFAWVFFRAESLDAALQVLAGIAAWQPSTAASISWFSPRLLVLIGGLLLIDVLQDRSGVHAVGLRYGGAWSRGFAYASLLLAMLLMGNLVEDVPFIYFQF
jgi:D-alanyl-lipoteichoic acid acyltransferase DltB (MBOAT superfamily)